RPGPGYRRHLARVGARRRRDHRAARAEGGRVTLRSIPGRTPKIHPGAWVDPAALVIGDVELAEGASVWPFAVVRGDEGQHIRIGRNTNVQDHTVVHVMPDMPCIIG